MAKSTSEKCASFLLDRKILEGASADTDRCHAETLGLDIAGSSVRALDGSSWGEDCGMVLLCAFHGNWTAKGHGENCEWNHRVRKKFGERGLTAVSNCQLPGSSFSVAGMGLWISRSQKRDPSTSLRAGSGAPGMNPSSCGSELIPTHAQKTRMNEAPSHLSHLSGRDPQSLEARDRGRRHCGLDRSLGRGHSPSG